MGWKCFSIICLIVGNLSAAAATEEDIRAILSMRTASNEALLKHDADAVLADVSDDFVLVGGSSGVAHAGKSVMRDYYRQGFSDPAFVTYVRTPDKITVSDDGDHASERGTWQGVWRGDGSGSLLNGEYMAHWVKRNHKWLTVAEIYVTLHCTGPVCGK